MRGFILSGDLAPTLELHLRQSGQSGEMFMDDRSLVLGPPSQITLRLRRGQGNFRARGGSETRTVPDSCLPGG